MIIVIVESGLLVNLQLEVRAGNCSLNEGFR